MTGDANAPRQATETGEDELALLALIDVEYTRHPPFAGGISVSNFASKICFV
jgi:hypothetical protein